MQWIDVHAEAVDAALEPEAQRLVHRGLDAGLVPVEVGLLGQEEVQVPLPRGFVPGPRRAVAEGRAPVVGRPIRRAVAPDVPAPLRRAPRRARLDEPGMLVARVVRNPVDQHAQPARVRVGQEPVEVGERAEERIDVAVVRDVVAVVLHRRAEERGDPDRVDAEPDQVIEVPTDALEVADAVAARVAEAARIDLVDDGGLPPGRVGVRHARILVDRGDDGKQDLTLLSHWRGSPCPTSPGLERAVVGF